jgi:cellulose synthase/poly-beta-1,6-N-acetylglucosamine synthase-like glycosyltransferase
MFSVSNLKIAWCAVGMIAAVISLPGTIELLCLTIAGMLPKRRNRAVDSRLELRNIAIVVPAHDEEQNIASCVEGLRNAESGKTRFQVVVIADNCSDRTAEVATRTGARVLVREDALLRGKGYALDFAFRRLIAEGIEGVLVVDADTEVDRNFVQQAAAILGAGADAVQARYLVRNAGDSIRTRLMNVAFLAFNVLRPRGRDRLGLSCGIYGNGFGLRASTLRDVPYLAGSVVEDLEYHLSLVRAGKRVQFADGTKVSGSMPPKGKGVNTQRSRWEGGRFRIMRDQIPALLAEVLHGKMASLEPLGDLLLLPLAFHVTLLAIAVSSPYGVARSLGLLGFVAVALHLFAAITVGGGDWRDVASLLAAPFYILWKLLLLPNLIRNSRSSSTWIRTERSPLEKPLK